MIVAIKRLDNTIAILRMIDGLDIATEISRWPEKDRAAIASWRIVSENEIPSDRTFRNAWRDNGEGALSHCMETCRALHRDRIREARAPLLAALDVEFQRAVESGSDTKAIVVKKQALRDITKSPAIEAAGTPEELKAAWPSDLI
jgi:hypothetical protein